MDKKIVLTHVKTPLEFYMFPAGIGIRGKNVGGPVGRGNGVGDYCLSSL